MSKNVIILGAARAGKTTLAKMIHDRYNYSIISIDSMVSAFRDGFPELKITHSNTENKFQRLPTFVYSYMQTIEEEYPNENFVLEGWHVYPSDISKLFINENIKIICLGYTEISRDEVFNIIRKTEEQNSYTKNMTDEELKDLVATHINYSKILKKQCEKCNIKYFDTSFNREKVLNQAIEYLIN